MKQKKFKKVVEWKEKPKVLGLILSMISFLIPITIFVNMSHYSLPVKVEGIIIIYALIISGVLEFQNSFGKGRKVYWEEIPQRASAAAIRRKTMK